MGLDISYGSNIEKAGIKPDDDTLYDYEISIWNEPCFEYQLGSLDRRYSYRWTSKSEHGSFRAGSYSGYNEWRRELIKMVGYDSLGSVCSDFGDKSFEKYNIRKQKLETIEGKEIERPKAFYELICFSDAEGSIGPEVAKKLYEDFVDYDKRAKNHSRETEYMSFNKNWFYEKYQEWKEAFRVASENGIVIFC